LRDPSRGSLFVCSATSIASEISLAPIFASKLFGPRNYLFSRDPYLFTTAYYGNENVRLRFTSVIARATPPSGYPVYIFATLLLWFTLSLIPEPFPIIFSHFSGNYLTLSTSKRLKKLQQAADNYSVYRIALFCFEKRIDQCIYQRARVAASDIIERYHRSSRGEDKKEERRRKVTARETAFPTYPTYP